MKTKNDSKVWEQEYVIDLVEFLKIGILWVFAVCIMLLILAPFVALTFAAIFRIFDFMSDFTPGL